MITTQRCAAEHGHTAWHGAIVGKAAIAVQFDPVRKTALNVIERERPLSVPRNLHPLPCRQVVVNLSARFAKLCLKFFHCRTEIDVVLCGMALQILQPPFQFKNRLFKIERLPFHESVKTVRRLKSYKVQKLPSRAFLFVSTL